MAAAPTELERQEVGCQEEWERLLRLYREDFAAIKAQWQQQETRCRGSGIYELHLATAQAGTGDLPGAIAMLTDALKAPLPLAEDLRVLRFKFQFSQALLAHPQDAAALAAANRPFEAYLKSRPAVPLALNEAARQRFFLKDYSGTVAAAKEALRQDPQAWESAYFLVQGAAQSAQYSLALPFIPPAVSQRPGLLADRDFMLAAALCYLETGQYVSAQQILNVLQGRNAGVVTDPAFNVLSIRAAAAAAAAHARS